MKNFHLMLAVLLLFVLGAFALHQGKLISIQVGPEGGKFDTSVPEKATDQAIDSIAAPPQQSISIGGSVCGPVGQAGRDLTITTEKPPVRKNVGGSRKVFSPKKPCK